MPFNKFEAKGKWGAKAALLDALDMVNDDDGVLVLISHKDKNESTFRAANITSAESIYMMEAKKFDMFFRYYEETDNEKDDE